jgi:hypothetical protein
MKFSNQGTLSTLGTTIHTAPDNNASELRYMRFNNALAYTLTVSKYTSATAATTQVYSVNLSAGDTITDSFPYFLNEGDYIRVTSSIAGTTFIAEGEDMPNINVVRCK